MWNELLSFPLQPSPCSPGAEAQACAAPLSPLRVSLRHHALTVFQRDSVIAEATVALPPADVLAAPGTIPRGKYGVRACY